MQWKLLMKTFKLVMLQFQTIKFNIHGRFEDFCIYKDVVEVIKKCFEVKG
jgi:hypothetical protein